MSVSRSSVTGHGLPAAVSAMMGHLRHLADRWRREPQSSPSDWRSEQPAPVGWWKAL